MLASSSAAAWYSGSSFLQWELKTDYEIFRNLPSRGIEFNKEILIVSNLLIKVVLVKDHDSSIHLGSQSLFVSGQCHSENATKFLHKF